MRSIPAKLKKQIEADPDMKVCIYNNADCRDEYGRKPGRPEWEHCFLHAGRQINERWAIIGACWYHHRGPGLNKAYNRYRAISRITYDELTEANKKYPKVDWGAMIEILHKQFGS